MPPKKRDHSPQYNPKSNEKNGVLIIGDSHCRGFINHPMIGPFQDGKGIERALYCHVFAGSSILGFGRRISAFQKKGRVHKIMRNYRGRISHVVFAFGQLDLDLGLYYYLLENNGALDIENHLNMVIRTYLDRIQEYSNSTIPIIKGINPTVLVSPGHSEKYVSRVITENESDPIQIKLKGKILQKLLHTIEQRNELASQFNKNLESQAIKQGVKYFDLNEELVNIDTNSINDIYCPAGQDHHIVDTIATRKLNRHYLAAAF